MYIYYSKFNYSYEKEALIKNENKYKKEKNIDQAEQVNFKCLKMISYKEILPHLPSTINQNS